MNYKAIDAVLLPSREMSEFVIRINRELTGHNEDAIVLSADGCLPHVTLCQGVVRTSDMQDVKLVLQGIAGRLSPVALRAQSLVANVDPTGAIISGVSIEKTDGLQKLHEEVMSGLRQFLSYSVDPSMYYQPDEVQPVTLTWIREFEAYFDNPSLFWPHITAGLGETEMFNFPVDFTATTLALCQLGNYNTCRNVLAAFDI